MSHGTLTLSTDRKQFMVTAQPHVMIRIKQCFPRINKSSFGEVCIFRTDEVCRDLEWFILRFQLDTDRKTLSALREGSDAHKSLQSDLQKFLLSEHVPMEFGLAEPLRDYQSRAVEIQLRKGSLLLCDQLGLGKSVTALGSLAAQGTLPALIVCQTHLTLQWQRYVNRFLPSAKTHIIKTGHHYDLPQADVFIITYAKLSGWGDVFCRPFFKSIIFDEIQELRHSNTQKYRASEAIGAVCRYRWGLSATPIYNYGSEIFSVMEQLSPSALGERHEFSREWCISNGKHLLIKEPKAFGAYLLDNFLMLRRTRRDVGMELPEVERVVQTIPYTAAALDEIKNVATELAHIVLKGSFHESGEAARQFDLRLRQATGIAKAPFVAEFVRMLIEDGQQVLLMGWHREVYDVWLERLKIFNPVMYTGSESPSQKEKAKVAFESGESKVMLMSLRAGSGLDGLQLACNTIVFGELDWSPGVHEQNIGRLNRDGLLKGVSAFFLVADGGSDPVVAEVVGLKKAQIVGMLDPQGQDNVMEMQTDMGRVKKMAAEYLSRHKDDREYVRGDGTSLRVIEGEGAARDPDALSSLEG